MDLADLAQFTRGDARRRRWLAAHASGAAQSLGETFVRVALREAGFAVEPQGRVIGVGAVDLLVEGRLVVEVDGYSYHRDAKSFAIDRARDRLLLRRDVPVMRFPHAEVVSDLSGAVLEVAETLWRRGINSRKFPTFESATRRHVPNPWWR